MEAPASGYFERRPWRFAALVVAAVFVVYAPALRGEFVFDDLAFVVSNELIRSPDGLRRFWLTTDAVDYQPLSFSAFWLQWRLWGRDPLGWHVVNVLLHAAVTLLVWRVLRKHGVPGAAVAALVFALHPVHVEAVAWVYQLRTLLPAALALSAWLMYLRGTASGSRSALAGAVTLFTLSLLSKPSFIALPALVLAHRAWQTGRLRLRDLAVAAPFGLIAIVVGTIALWFQSQNAIGDAVVRDDGMLSRLLIAGRAVWFYLGKLLLPTDLALIYPRWPLPAAWSDALPLAALIAAVAVLWRWRRTWARPLFFALACYVLLLLPVLGFVDISYFYLSLVADHWQYGASVAALAGAAAVVAPWLRKRQTPAWLPACALAALLVCCGALTWRQASLFAGPIPLWTDAVARNPGCALAWQNLGTANVERRDYAAALDCYERAWRIEPNVPRHGRHLVETRLRLGAIAAESGRTAQAVDHYRRALRVDPRSATAHGALAELLLSAGQTPEARRHALTAVEIDPDTAVAHALLGDMDAAAGNIAAAAEHFARAVELAPGLVRARAKLADQLAALGRSHEAIRHYRLALRRQPDLPAAAANLAWIYATSAGHLQPAEAVRLAEHADRLTGGAHPVALDALAAAYAASGRWEEAATVASRAAAAAERQGNAAFAREIAARRQAYLGGRPWRDEERR